MSTPWFTELVAWLPGTLFGVVGGIFGAFVGAVLSSEEKKTRWSSFVTRGYWLLLFVSIALLVFGVTALLVHQPYGVWYALLLPGLVGSTSLGLQYRNLFSRLRPAPEKWPLS